MLLEPRKCTRIRRWADEDLVETSIPYHPMPRVLCGDWGRRLHGRNCPPVGSFYLSLHKDHLPLTLSKRVIHIWRHTILKQSMASLNHFHALTGLLLLTYVQELRKHCVKKFVCFVVSGKMIPKAPSSKVPDQTCSWLLLSINTKTPCPVNEIWSCDISPQIVLDGFGSM